MFNFNLRLVLIALAVGLVMVACGGSQKQDADLKKATEKMVEEAIKGASFTKSGQTKIDSFGKTEKDKRIVAYDVFPNDNKYEYYVVVYDDGGWVSSNYRLFFDSEDGKRYYGYVNEDYIAEKDDNGLWVKTKLESGYSSWQEAYDHYKNEGYKFVE
ncbi:MAG: hypothetical protein FWG85_02185 [Bacteroidetes bacterium]|nr:hypothetical protein [Bacteroidota bacterium]